MRINIAQHDWKRWGVQGKEFMKGAGRYLEDGNFTLALFCLNQAAESSLIAIIRVVLGYRLSAHNLLRMVDLSCLFTNAIREELKLDDPKENRLFKLLQAGYSEARYKNNFTPDAHAVKLLKIKVDGLLALTERLYERFLVMQEESNK